MRRRFYPVLWRRIYLEERKKEGYFLKADDFFAKIASGNFSLRSIKVLLWIFQILSQAGLLVFSGIGLLSLLYPATGKILRRLFHEFFYELLGLLQ